ncbi:MAG: hypothetical protein JXB39_00200 [Deltaproteobacteria bacterium]|nr:hypothetical protein [Deltaproteobacteria bacterium]
MRRLWPVLGLLVFAACSLATIQAVRGSGIPGSEEGAPSICYEVPSRGILDLNLPAEVETVRLQTHTFAPPGMGENPVQWLDYPVRLEWIDGSGQRVQDRTFVERTRVTWFPSLGSAPPRWATRLLHDPRIVTDGRTTLVPGRAVLPDGGVLRVSGGETGLLLRPFGSVDSGGVGAALQGFTATRQAREAWTRRTGLPDWSLLDLGERRSVAGTAWHVLRPAGGKGTGHLSRWITSADLTLSSVQQQTAGIVLAPGRSVALDLVGPLAVRISGGEDVSSLDHHLVWENHPDAWRASCSPDTPLGLPGETRAVRYDLLLDGPVSLHLHNRTGRPVGPILASLDHPDPEAIAGWSVGALLEEVDPARRGEEGTLLGPEWRYMGGWRIDAAHRVEIPLEWMESGAPVKIIARPILSGPGDRTPRVLDVEAVGDDGVVEWRAEASVPATPSRYETVLPGRGWIGEATVLFVPHDPQVRRLSVGAAREMVVVVRTRSAPVGEAGLHPRPETPDVILRFRQLLASEWHVVLPDGGDLPQIRFAANVRLERRGARDLDGDGIPEPGVRETPHWRSLGPADERATGRTWLVPGPRTRPGLLYCRHEPQEGNQRVAWGPEAVRALEGRLKGVLWTPDASSLGRAFQVRLDGAPWRRGRLRQRVTRLSGAGERARTHLSFQGPAGSSLWVRTWGEPDEACAAPHRPLVAWPVDAGSGIVFQVEREWPGQLVSVGGFADSDAELRVLLDGGHVSRRAGLLEAFSDADRDWMLVPTPDRAIVLDDPDLEASVLQPRALALGEDLVGATHRIEVVNRSDERVWIRAAIQSDQPTGPARAEEPGMVPAGGGE